MSSLTNKIRKQKLISLGLCYVCGHNPIEFSRSKNKCLDCLSRATEQQKNRYKTDKKKIQACQKRCREKKLEYYREMKRNLYEKHKEQWLHDRKVRMYQRRHAEGKHTFKEWKDLLSSFGNKCLWCGTDKSLERDHVVPISKGGTNYITNIQPLCKTCNRRKWNKIIDFRPFGNIIMDWT